MMRLTDKSLNIKVSPVPDIFVPNLLNVVPSEGVNIKECIPAPGELLLPSSDPPIVLPALNIGLFIDVPPTRLTVALTLLFARVAYAFVLCA